MLSSLVSFSLRYRAVVVVVAGVMLVTGVWDSLRLPQQVQRPHVLPPLSSTSRALHIGLAPKTAKQLKPGEKQIDQTDVSVAMKWIIEPRLRAVPGVANVSTYGLQHKQYQVL